jgi:hypothetical protein
MREEPVTSKRTLLTERVKIGKIETDRQTITRPVRTEDVEIVKIQTCRRRAFPVSSQGRFE